MITPQDPQLAAAVDAGGVGQLLGDRHEELPQQEDREGVAEEAGTISGFSVPTHSMPVHPVYLAKMMYSDTVSPGWAT